jgi:hypothetical protein
MRLGSDAIYFWGTSVPGGTLNPGNRNRNTGVSAMPRFTKRSARNSQVDIAESTQVQYWAHKLGCTVEQLRAAVKAVGSDAAAVTNYFLRVATRKQALAM